MTRLSELWKHFRFLTDLETLPKDRKAILEEFLRAEYKLREPKRIESLLRMSGIKRVKLLTPTY